ncbi:hypothetical protein GCM10009111_22920 [Colwellia asteriadis]|uniref:Uncharacterized protein n=1 Tax=Colwellia asteriadis TaxID=517723 RepID=A0ABN1L858_9GAMM
MSNKNKEVTTVQTVINTLFIVAFIAFWVWIAVSPDPIKPATVVEVSAPITKTYIAPTQRKTFATGNEQGYGHEGLTLEAYCAIQYARGDNPTSECMPDEREPAGHSCASKAGRGEWLSDYCYKKGYRK